MTLSRRVVDRDEPELERLPRPVHRRSFTLAVGSLLLMVVGALFLLVGLGMDTTIRSKSGDEIHNLGLLFDKQLKVLGGFAAIGIGLLVEILQSVRGLMMYRQRQGI